MILLLLTLIILIDVKVFNHPIDFMGSFLQQALYGLWIYCFISIPVKKYNEFCDKKDAEKQKEKKLSKK